MSDEIMLEKFRQEADEEFVGFRPNGSSVKPVHVADGALRVISGKVSNNGLLKRVAYVESSKGYTPKGNEPDVVKAELKERDCFVDSSDIDDKALLTLRRLMQRLVGADNGVFYPRTGGVKDGMVSFTAASDYFMVNQAAYEDMGEFMGSLLMHYCPVLTDHIKSILQDTSDPISMLFRPVFEEGERKSVHALDIAKMPAFADQNDKMRWFLSGLRTSGNRLAENLKRHPNPLTQLRLFNLFQMLQLIRYMALLAAFYCDEPIRPILLDFTNSARTSVAQASAMSFTQVHRAISRFYAWAYAELLKKKFDIDELMASPVPRYKEAKKSNDDKKKSKAQQDTEADLARMWSMAKEDAAAADGDREKYLIFGAAVYDMLALSASSSPVICLKALGMQAGVLYPPDAQHPNKRFKLSQDVIEMLMRSCVEHGATVSVDELRTQLWECFGIIVGGSSYELEQLGANSAILMVDADSLRSNFDSFTSMLESMGFAEVLADGILQIRLGGV